MRLKKQEGITIMQVMSINEAELFMKFQEPVNKKQEKLNDEPFAPVFDKAIERLRERENGKV